MEKMRTMKSWRLRNVLAVPILESRIIRFARFELYE